MWPWAHAGVGYLAYSLGWTQGRRHPSGISVLVLGVATQFPDLIDKPFAWTVPLLPGGRSLAHSLLVAVPLVACVLVYARYRERAELGAVFGIGYLSHLFADVLETVVTDTIANTTFLLWPVLPLPETATAESFLTVLATLQPTPWNGFELVLTGLGAVLWVNDGLPGVDWLRNAIAQLD
jgi:Predicted membrane-bound metal-dependent hydrolase (DUF457).